LLTGRRAYADIFFCMAHVQRVGVRLRVHRHGLDSQFLTGPDDAQGYFSAVGNEYLLEQGVSRSRGAYAHQWLIVFNRFGLADQYLDNLSFYVGLDLIHDLHGFYDADGLPGLDLVSLAHKGIVIR
jgi:hypothetical protein